MTATDERYANEFIAWMAGRNLEQFMNENNPNIAGQAASQSYSESTLGGTVGMASVHPHPARIIDQLCDGLHQEILELQAIRGMLPVEMTETQKKAFNKFLLAFRANR